MKYSLRSLMIVVTMICLTMGCCLFLLQEPSVVLNAKSGASCRLYTDWFCDNGGSIWCDVSVNGSTVAKKEFIEVFSCSDGFPKEIFSMADAEGLIVVFADSGWQQGPHVIFAYSRQDGVLKSFHADKLPKDKEVELVTKYYPGVRG